MMSRNAGLTMVELVIVAAVLIPVLLTVLLTGSVTSRTISINERRSAVNGRVWMTMNQVVRPLRGASLSRVLCFDPTIDEGTWVAPQEGIEYSAIRFQSLADPKTSTLLTLAPLVTVAWQPEAGEVVDSIDQDGDGLVDEGHLILRRAGQGRVVLTNNVERFVVKRLGQSLEVRLQLGVPHGRIVERASGTQRVILRNN
jgi:hypothetical protein